MVGLARLAFASVNERQQLVRYRFIFVNTL